MIAYLLTEARWFTLNSPRAACQIIGQEAILIHFERGHYFSAAGSGVWVLERVLGGDSAPQIEAAFAQHFAIDPERAQRLVAALLEQLVAEDLFAVVERAELAEHLTLSSDPSGTASDADANFEEPRLVKFTDLEDLLILDPIHDVIATGWPVPAERAGH